MKKAKALPKQEDPQAAVREAQERLKFEKSAFVQKETMRAFSELKQHEYRLVSMYKPHLLTQNFTSVVQEIADKEREAMVQVEVNKLNDREARDRYYEEINAGF